MKNKVSNYIQKNKSTQYERRLNTKLHNIYVYERNKH